MRSGPWQSTTPGFRCGGTGRSRSSGSPGLLSNAGSQVSELAIPLIAVLTLSAGPTAMGILTALEALPSLLLGLLLGVFVDRIRRGRTLFWCNVGQGVLMGTVPLAAAFDLLTMAQLYIVTFAVGSLALVYGLAHTAYIPALVKDRRQLTAANSSIALTDSITSVAGPGLGGVLVQLLTAPVAIAVDSASFFVAAFLQACGRGPDPVPTAEKSRFGLSVRAGFAAFRRQSGIVAITVGKGSLDFFHWGVLALYILYAVRELGLSPAEIGVIAAIGSLGPLLAGVITTPVSRRFGTTWTSVVAAVLLGGDLLIPLAGGPTIVVIATIGPGATTARAGRRLPDHRPVDHAAARCRAAPARPRRLRDPARRMGSRPDRRSLRRPARRRHRATSGVAHPRHRHLVRRSLGRGGSGPRTPHSAGRTVRRPSRHGTGEGLPPERHETYPQMHTPCLAAASGGAALAQMAGDRLRDAVGVEAVRVQQVRTLPRGDELTG